MPTLAIGLAPTSTSVSVELTAGPGETAWQWEFSRAADFSSDESWTGNPGAGTYPIHGLLEDTVYYVRARKTNGGNGPWSATLMLKTAPGAVGAVPAYNGLSIEPAVLVVPEPIAEIYCGSAEAGSDPYNLLNDDPLSTLRFQTNGRIYFRTTGRPIDTFCVLGTQINETVQWRIAGAATLIDLANGAFLADSGVQLFRTSLGIGPRPFYHGYHRFAVPSPAAWWALDFFDPIGGVGPGIWLTARHMVCGLARSSVNISRGAGHAPLDLGRVERNQFGSPDRVRGWRGRTVEFPLSWIREAEYEAKWRDLDQVVGMTDPVLALPNPKRSRYLNDRIAYGEISSMRGEIVHSTKYARSIEIRSLY